MASMTIRDLVDRLKQRLRVEAARNNRSMEAEARAIESPHWPTITPEIDPYIKASVPASNPWGALVSR